MKISVNLVGISYGERNRDWRQTKNFVKEKFIDCWDTTPDVYITTYENETISELIEFYKPVKYSIIGKDEVSDQRLTYIKSLSQIENCDVVVSTRFDIELYNKLSLYDIDFNKFNFLFREMGWWHTHKFISDNIFVFPFNFIKDVTQSIKEEYENPLRPSCMDLHNIYNRLSPKIGEDSINCLWKEQGLSHENAHYKLHRS